MIVDRQRPDRVPVSFFWTLGDLYVKIEYILNETGKGGRRYVWKAV